MKFNYILLAFLVCALTGLSSCKRESELKREIDNIQLELEVERFDKLFAESNVQQLPDLMKKYPFLFPKQYTQKDWEARLNDSLQQVLHREVGNTFKQMDEEEAIISLFKHLAYYDPAFRTPRVITVTSDVDYRNRIIVTDTIVLIALDNYLGEDHEFYGGIQQYLKQNFDRAYLVSDLAEAYAKRRISLPRSRRLLDDMIYQGKLLYFKDLMMPDATDEIKIGYTPEELEWAKTNEISMWSYFVENELLFSTDSKLASRFINPAPFSKFNLELDNESPGRLGRYIGWQIVRSYAEKNDLELSDVILADTDEVFNNAKFKPRR